MRTLRILAAAFLAGVLLASCGRDPLAVACPRAQETVLWMHGTNGDSVAVSVVTGGC